MNEDQYLALCEVCDRLLMESDSDIERIASPWLHVIRPHPIFLSSYYEIFGPQASVIDQRRLRSTASALRRLIISYLIGGEPWSNVGELPSKCDVLMVSHLVNKSFSCQEGDFYYGNAASELATQGINTTIALINYTDMSPAALAVSWRQAKIPRVILSSLLSPAIEWALYHRARTAARRLRSAVRSHSSDLDRRVVARAAVEATCGGAVSALRLVEQIKALVIRLQPRAIVVTYEGHSWERVAFAAARAVLPKIRCIGYQHAALFNQQHALQRRLADIYNPDVILTSGNISRARLQQNSELQGVQIKTLGSNRSCVRQPVRQRQASKSENHACLVLPEGIISESILLFGFALECAKNMPNIEFIWRLHPNMSHETLTQKSPAFGKLPSNVTLSSETLAEDIARSNWALYRGSTAIVQAVMSGLQAVYLHQTGEILIDTLYEIASLRAQVIEPDDFMVLVSEAESEDFVAKAEQVQDYCEQMFTPMDARVLAECIIKSQ